MRPVRYDLSQSLAAKQTVATSASGPVPGARERQLLSTSTRPTGSGKAIEEARPRSRRGGDVLFRDSVDGKQPLAREIAINATRCRCQAFAQLSSRSTSGPPSSRSAVRRRFTCTRQVADLARLQVRFGARERSLGIGTTELVCREPTLSSPFVRDVPVEEFSRVRHSLRREDDASENRGKSM